MPLPRPTHVYQEGAAVEPGRAARCALALGEASKRIGFRKVRVSIPAKLKSEAGIPEVSPFMRQRFALENILRRCFGSPSIVIAVYCSNNFSIPTGASSRLMRVHSEATESKSVA